MLRRPRCRVADALPQMAGKNLCAVLTIVFHLLTFVRAEGSSRVLTVLSCSRSR